MRACRPPLSPPPLRRSLRAAPPRSRRRVAAAPLRRRQQRGHAETPGDRDKCPALAGLPDRPNALRAEEVDELMLAGVRQGLSPSEAWDAMEREVAARRAAAAPANGNGDASSCPALGDNGAPPDGDAPCPAFGDAAPPRTVARAFGAVPQPVVTAVHTAFRRIKAAAGREASPPAVG